MATLVTGGSGVVGMHVLLRLAELGERAVAYSTSGAPQCADVLLADAAKQITFVQGDIGDQERLLKTVDDFGVSGVIHAAALTGEAQARARPLDAFRINVAGTVNVLEVARRRGLRRVVYLGSASEYGRRRNIDAVREEETAPEYLYAETKFLGHRLGERYRAVFDMDVVTVRVSSVYGPHTRFNPYRKLVGNTLMAHLCRSAVLGTPVALEGGGDYPRDWTYAADAARGICLTYQAPALRYSAYNVASGRSYTVNEVVATLCEIRPDLRATVGAGNWDDDPFQAGNLRGPLDIARARGELGFEPRYTLAAGLAEYMKWWRRIEGIPA